MDIVKKGMEIDMTNKELGELFLELCEVDENGYSKELLIDDLVKIDPGFRTSNGCQWARSDQGVIGSKYLIERTKKGNRTYSVKLVGLKAQTNHNIPSAIRAALQGKPCAVLGTTCNTEIDHKDASYKTLNLTINDFQVLHKSVNDAKRQHCKNCKATNSRFDATQLGYKIPYLCGSASFTDSGCKGCYWYDVKEFNKEISKNA